MFSLAMLGQGVVRRGATVVVLAGVAGCGSLQNVPIRDNGSPDFAVRATFHGTSAASQRPSGPGLEMGVEGYSAKGRQVLKSGEAIVLDGASLFGPDTLSHRMRLEQFYVAYNHRLRLGSQFELEPYVGVTHLRAKLSTTTQSGTDVTPLNSNRYGVTGGITPRWRINDWVAAELRVNFLDSRLQMSGSNYEAALMLTPSPQVGLRLGVSDRHHTFDSGLWGLDTSQIDVRARGVLVGLQLDF